jgi:hypothetical protein
MTSEAPRAQPPPCRHCRNRWCEDEVGCFKGLKLFCQFWFACAVEQGLGLVSGKLPQQSEDERFCPTVGTPLEHWS